MHIVRYPHPTLRYESKNVARVDNELRQIVAQMFKLMYEAQGVGLAANQVDLPLRLFVVNLAAIPGEGEELVFINPVISHPKGTEEGEEGCLSLPGLYGPVWRPRQVRITAYNLEGHEVRADVTGLMARVVQHEFDHLNGVLFPDRMAEEERRALREPMLDMEQQFQQQRESGQVASDEVLAAQRAEWVRRYG